MKTGCDSDNAPMSPSPNTESPVLNAARTGASAQLAPIGRWRAAGIHLTITLCIACLAALLVFGIWYPHPYRTISGGLELFVLLVSADVIIGPLLTAVVFNRAKGSRQLRFDLGVIALLQIVFLAYGLHSVFLARPVYMVHEVDRFRVITAVDLAADDLAAAPEPYRTLPIAGPELIGTRRSAPGADQLKSVLLALEGKDLAQRPDHYQPFELSRKEALERARPIDELLQKHPQQRQEILRIVTQTGKAPQALLYIPVVARQQWVALVDAHTADILAYAPFDGF